MTLLHNARVYAFAFYYVDQILHQGRLLQRGQLVESEGQYKTCMVPNTSTHQFSAVLLISLTALSIRKDLAIV